VGKRIINSRRRYRRTYFSGIAIANALKKKDNSIEILFVGAKGKMEMEKCHRQDIKLKELI
jgi:UDP-N-acetylglucosamine--N-acetylmuramyl-(pentapeptide) pyrophosphoryl-undecaprenol N-acetylglucosamine transferase